MKMLSAFFIIFLLLFFGCVGQNVEKQQEETPKKEPVLFYKIKYCEGGGPVNDVGFIIEKSQDVFLIRQKENYVCCANITVIMEIDEQNKTILLYEENIGDYCRCICPFEAEISVKNANNYSLEIYGIKYRDVYNYTLMQKWPDGQECYRDIDCAIMPTCCHPYSNKCMPRKNIKNWPDCSNEVCTLECQPCYFCSCIEGKCASNLANGCC